MTVNSGKRMFTKEYEPTNKNKKFLFTLAKITTFYGLAYSGFFFYLGLKVTANVLLATALIFYPSLIFLCKHKYERSARYLLIGASLIYIYTSIVTIPVNLNAEFYYLPAMLLSLLVFDVKQKKEALVGVCLPFFAWILGLKGIAPVIQTSSHYIDLIPVDFFVKINFAGSLIITGLIIKFYRSNLLDLNLSLTKEYERIKKIGFHLKNAQRLAKVGNWENIFSTNELIWSDEVYNIFEVEKNEIEVSMEYFMDNIHPEDREFVSNAYQYALKTGQPYEIVHRILQKDGRIKFVREKSEIHYDEFSQPFSSMGTIQDITEMKVNDAFINHTSKLVALGEMAGGIAHEINNPLAIIQGNAASCLKKMQSSVLDKEGIEKTQRKIMSSVDRISKIMKSLKSISRNSEEDPMQLSAVLKLVEDVHELLTERFFNKSVQLTIDIPADLQIMCRPSEIVQVILNLINNSYDAVMNLEEKWIEVKAVSTRDFVRIFIIDSGKGIPKENLNKLMFPFFTTKEVGKGTGLGLSISKKIVENHSGKFYYDETSCNTCFIIELPIPQSTSIELKSAS
jgi:signal transduction histidine kinase